MMIQKATFTATLLIAGSASASEVKDVDLGGDVVMSLAEDWDVKSHPNIAMTMPSVRETVADASDVRIKKPDTGVLVSYVMLKSDLPAPDSTSEGAVRAQEQQMRGAVRGYLRQSVETSAEVISNQNGPLSISKVTLTAREGQFFNVSPGYPGGCVTTVSIKRGHAFHVISVASKTCDVESHTDMVEAVSSARTTGI